MEQNNNPSDISRADTLGAKEDFLHIDRRKEGYDLRDASEVGKKQFQEK